MKYLAILVLLLAPAIAPAQLRQFDPSAQSGGDMTVAADHVFFWFDEKPSAGEHLMFAVATQTAYRESIKILKSVVPPGTKPLTGTSVLDSNIEPSTIPMSKWISQQPDQSKVPSLFYWANETLSDDTPVMRFFITPRAYTQVTNIVAQYMNGEKVKLDLPQSKRRSFAKILLEMAAGAAQGMADYYTYTYPAEYAALQQQNAARQSNYYQSQQVYNLQRLNQQLDQIQQQRILGQINQNYDQYYRVLERMKTGQWPR